MMSDRKYIYFDEDTSFSNIAHNLGPEQVLIHHTAHFRTGFILDPMGQLNSLAKSTLFCSVPMIR